MRCLELTADVLKDRPPQQVLEFVRRLSRCYIAGFLPECVILCRAILETAVRERFARARRRPPSAPPGKSEMKARLSAARANGWLSASTFDAAWIVWTRGNKAIHEGPHITHDVRGTVRLTMAALADLSA